MNLTAPDGGASLMIVDIARLLRRRFEAALTEIDTGLTVAEARTLAFIWRNPGQRQAALAERMFVEPMTLVGYLDSLEKAGLVVRTVDPTDRRAKLITLTDEADPILIRAKSLGQGYPSKDMLVSPAQTVWVPSQSKGWVGVTAMRLAHSRPNIHSIHRTELTYYRFHCGEPETVCVEGGWFCTAP